VSVKEVPHSALLADDAAAADALPSGWRLELLGPRVDIKSGESPSSFRFAAAGTPYFKVEQLNNSNKYLGRSETPYFVDSAKSVRKGSVIFPKRGASILLNKVRVLAENAYMDTNLMTLTARDGLVDEYLFYAIVQARLASLADTTSIPQINNKHITPLKILVPPEPEQRAIAGALSDADTAVTSLDLLIRKKRDVKLAARQALLTGNTRLPGFDDEWEVKAIGEFATCTAGGTPSTAVPSYWNGAIRWMSSGELNAKLVSEVEDRITEAGLKNSSAKLLPVRCVLIGLAGQGKTRGTVAMNTVKLATNQSIAAVLPNDAFAPEYLFHNLDARYEELRAMSSGGGGRGGLNLQIIRSVRVPFPSVSEQNAIAAVLSDMDAEITALQIARKKMAAIKDGMLHALLTGRTRLVDEVSAP
jgi:type I restriction enzyme S subunit